MMASVISRTLNAMLALVSGEDLSYRLSDNLLIIFLTTAGEHLMNGVETSTNQNVRTPAVAGQFYPGDAVSLGRTIDGFLDQVTPANDTPGSWPKAIIAPHAGYVYSGPVAASVYACLKAAKGTVNKVVLLGPAHRVAFRGIAVPTVAAFDTPLGPVPLDREAIEGLAAHASVLVSDEAHAQEHSLEVHLPFLQRILGDFSLVPLCVGDASPDDVAEVLETLWGGPETLIVISTDLSHYHGYDEARLLDQATAQAITDRRLDDVTTHGACGGRPVKGLLKVAQKRNLEISLLDIRNSGDTAGPKDRVVGYASFRVDEPIAASKPVAKFDMTQRSEMLKVARAAIAEALASGKAPALKADDYPAWAQQPGAAFVTLEMNGKLRGCIGSLAAHRPLIIDVSENAFAAAFRDPRFPNLGAAEFENLEISISVLSEPEPLDFENEADLLEKMRPGVDGLILQSGSRRGTFLPQVWEQLPQKSSFLAHLKSKAGFSADYWSDDIKIFRYTTESFR
jgi:MEMO1 family protein